MKRTLLVIPHYNDTERLKPFLAELLSGLSGQISILISDDGSTRQEREKLLSIYEKSRIQPGTSPLDLLPPIFTSNNTGKGGAIIRGWEHREGFHQLAFVDADGAVAAGEIMRAEAFFNSGKTGTDALFCSRVKMLGRIVSRSLTRHLSGRVFATLVSIAGNVPAYDTQCGLKIIKTAAYEKVRPYLQTEGFSFDVELLLLLLEQGFEVEEFPVDWHDVKGSKVNLLKDSLQMTLEVFRIKRRIWKRRKTAVTGIKQP